LKRITIIFLIISFIVQATGNLILLARFYYNRDYIASTLCENRFKPASACKGNCYLKKQIARQEQQQEKLPEVKTREIILFFEAGQKFQFTAAYPLAGSTRKYPNTSARLISTHLSKIFKPPRNLV
jgi:hypothetical protein